MRMKLECLENPGPHETIALRDCDQNRFIPFGVCHIEDEKTWRVYHTPSGLWVFAAKEADCNVFLTNLEGLCADVSVDWDFAESKGLKDNHVKLLHSARDLTK